MKYNRIALFLVVTITIQCLTTMTVNADEIWSTMQSATSYESKGDYDLAITEWLKLVALYESNSDKMDWTNYAMYLEKIGDYYAGLYNVDLIDRPLAVFYYDLSSNAYTEANLTWGIVQTSNKANALRTDIQVYIEKDASTKITSSDIYVPSIGAYLGMYAEKDDRLISSGHVDPDKQAATFGKYLPIQLVYSTFNVSSFPSGAASNMSQSNGGLQVAMEPSQGLEAVTDNTYIRNWAKEANASAIPIFLRFGGEMNGEWVSWGLSPELFIEKFKLIHDIMAQEAPNVVMLWSPNDIPYYNMMDYYPGDDYVDWVGVSTYCVPDGNGHTDLSNYALNPLDKLEHIYDLFAGNKPIMLSESAVAYEANNFQTEDFTDWYAMNMARYYHYIPRLYPEIKAIVYFNHQETYNSYKLSESPSANTVYKDVISSDYFLETMDALSLIEYELLEGQTLEKEPITFSCYANIYDPFISHVDYWLDDTLVKTTTTIPYDFHYDFTDLEGSSAKLTIKVYDSKGIETGQVEDTLLFNSDNNVMVLQIDNPSMIYNGVTSPLDPGNGTSPIIINNRTMIPIRAVVEKMGGTIQWEGETQQVTILQGDKEILLWINKPIAQVNGSSNTMDASPVIVGGRTLLPVRFITENLGATVLWNGQDQSITITY